MACKTKTAKENRMEIIGTRRRFFGKFGAALAFMAGAPKLFSQQGHPGRCVGAWRRQASSQEQSHTEWHLLLLRHRRQRRLSRRRSCAGDRSFEKHVTRTMDALKRRWNAQAATWTVSSLSRSFFCLPLADGFPCRRGRRGRCASCAVCCVEQDLRTYFSPGKHHRVHAWPWNGFPEIH